MKIYILDACHPAGIELAKKFCDVVCWPDAEIANWPENADGVMVRMTPITSDELKRADHVKVICKQGVGFETIDIDAAKKYGIPILRTPGINSEAVAEMAFALSLSVTRRITRFDRMLRNGQEIIRPNHLGIEMLGKTVGIIGMGNIGTRIAKKWLGAFDAKIIAFDPYAPKNQWADFPHRRVDQIQELLTEADLVTLHLPLNTENHHLIGVNELSLMKSNSVLINVSRGGLVDELALYDHLKNGHLFGAGLDVFEVEPPDPTHPLLSLENLIATPHAAGGTYETQERSSLCVAQQVIDVLQGKEPQNRIN